MPLIKLHTSAEVTKENKQALLKEMSELISTSLGKPEQYVMAVITDSDMMMSGNSDGAAFVDIRSIGGLTPEINRKISKDLCDILQNALNVSSSRIFINFIDISRSDWGWNGGTFG